MTVALGNAALNTTYDWPAERARGRYWVTDPMFGAVGDGTTDDSSAIDACIAAAGEETGTVLFPAGVFNIGTGLSAITANNLHVKGMGWGVTKLLLTPTGDGDIAMNFDKGGTAGFYWEVSDLSIKTTDTSYNKTAIRMEDARSCRIDRVHIEDFGGAGTDSIGIQLLGRELVTFNQLKIDANVPIRLSKNPNESTIDVDEFNFTDLYMISSDTTDTLTRACILADGDVIFKRLYMSGSNAFVKGDYGFYYVTSGLVAVSQRGISINGFHTEQMETTGWSIYIDATGGSNSRFPRNLSLRDGHLQETNNGIYIRGVEHVGLSQMTMAHGSAKTILDIDGASDKTLSMNWEGVWTLPTSNSPGAVNVSSLALVSQFRDENDTPLFLT